MEPLPSSSLVWLIPGLPLVGFLFHAFLGKWTIERLGESAGRRTVGGIATAVVLVSFAISAKVAFDLFAMPGESKRAVVGLIPGGYSVPWIDIGTLHVSFAALIDPLSVLMCLTVTGVGGLIHLYATGYMAHDKDYARFFTYFNLFIFSMLLLVLGDSILLMFVGWEGVGACSYLLISFWYEEPDNARAGNKAFIVNRVGDVGFVLGVMMVFAVFGTMQFHNASGTGFLDLASQRMTASGPLLTTTATLIALLLFFGACGKSAQFPLHIWLPDAMAGPTPVSALIHAATMVTAGVVMVTRMSHIFVQSPTAMVVVASVGLFTAVFAASIALVQTDIKKVLAYSTVSQLGFMFLACGAGAFGAGMFHVMTHAFFKGLLFLGAGSVIHALSGQQDMRHMGGLSKRIKVTHATMVAGWLSIAGIPPLAGFWSKDAILAFASGMPVVGPAFYGIGLLAALMTGFYMTRMMAKTFYTKQRFAEPAAQHVGDGEAHAPTGVHESPPSMTVPLVILACLSIIGGLVGTPFANWFEHFLEPSLPSRALYAPHEAFEPVVGLIIGFLVAAASVVLALRIYRQRFETGELMTAERKARDPIFRALSNLWFVDRAAWVLFVQTGGQVANGVWRIVDQGLVDGAVNGTAWAVGALGAQARRVQTGYVRTYATSMVVGAVIILIGLWAAAGRH